MEFKFFFLGIAGALIASMTGTGGGIVFFPAFVALGITPLQSAATSVMIQSVGMTAGSVSWYMYFRKIRSQIILLVQAVLIASIFSVLGEYTYVFFIKHWGLNIHLIFRLFSFAIVVILAFNFFYGKSQFMRFRLAQSDVVWLIIIGFVGGMITAVISIGVGEAIAAFLMFRRFRPDFAIAAAVVVTAISMIALVPHFTMFSKDANMQIALSAIPGTAIGGFCARYIAKAISLKKLKILFMGWVLLAALL